MSHDLIIVVHGGAWAVPDDKAAASVAGVSRAAEDGMRQLLKGLATSLKTKGAAEESHEEEEEGDGNRRRPTASSPAVEATVCAVSTMEDDPTFDAGYGSTLTLEGKIEMDAVVASANSSSIPISGAVAALSGVRHPVQVARQVMLDTDHCLLVADGASAFAKKIPGIQVASDADLTTSEMRRELDDLKKYGHVVHTLFNNGSVASASLQKQEQHDTVGSVALDHRGNLSTATSTGGITAKYPGRVGDSPLLGAGAFCDFAGQICSSYSDVGDAILAACSATGHGESLLKIGACQRVAAAICPLTPPTVAIRRVLSYMKSRVGGCGGVICVDSKGRIGISFSTARMPWATARISVAEASQLLIENNFDVSKIKIHIHSGIEPESMEEAATC